MKNKIKNCHWCGVEAEVKHYQIGDNINDKIFYVRCTKCGIKSGFADTEEEAIKRWNEL
jgi:Lar family restriction alleviation protein